MLSLCFLLWFPAKPAVGLRIKVDIVKHVHIAVRARIPKIINHESWLNHEAEMAIMQRFKENEFGRTRFSLQFLQEKELPILERILAVALWVSQLLSAMNISHDGASHPVWRLWLCSRTHLSVYRYFFWIYVSYTNTYCVVSCMATPLGLKVKNEKTTWENYRTLETRPKVAAFSFSLKRVNSILCMKHVLLVLKTTGKQGWQKGFFNSQTDGILYFIFIHQISSRMKMIFVLVIVPIVTAVVVIITILTMVWNDRHQLQPHHGAWFIFHQWSIINDQVKNCQAWRQKSLTKQHHQSNWAMTRKQW